MSKAALCEVLLKGEAATLRVIRKFGETCNGLE